jgi:hypothetical protein
MYGSNGWDGPGFGPPSDAVPLLAAPSGVVGRARRAIVLEAEMRFGLFALALVSIALGACQTYGGYTHSNAGHAYVVENKRSVIQVLFGGADNNVWNCDATGGKPQCWRVIEK